MFNARRLTVLETIDSANIPYGMDKDNKKTIIMTNSKEEMSAPSDIPVFIMEAFAAAMTSQGCYRNIPTELLTIASIQDLEQTLSKHAVQMIQMKQRPAHLKFMNQHHANVLSL